MAFAIVLVVCLLLISDKSTAQQKCTYGNDKVENSFSFKSGTIEQAIKSCKTQKMSFVIDKKDINVNYIIEAATNCGLFAPKLSFSIFLNLNVEDCNKFIVPYSNSSVACPQCTGNANCKSRYVQGYEDNSTSK